MATVKFTTGLVRLSFAHLAKPHVDMNGNENYSAMFLVPKSDEKGVKTINDAIAKLKGDDDAKAKWGKGANVRSPLRDGDAERPSDKTYKGCYFFNAKSNIDHQPDLYDKDRNAIVAPDEIYSGCWGQAILTLYPYNNSGNKGIGVGILAFRKIKDGPHLGGMSASADDFNDDLLEDTDIPF